MKIITFLLTLLICSSSFAQDRMVMNRHKFYDTTKVENFQKVKRRRLTMDVDSTGIAMYAWGDECYFKINLLQRMFINANFYETGIYNNAPYMRYGNDNFKFRMYINDGGNFEFDAKIMNKSPKGRHELPFNIQTKGLTFYFQPELTQAEIDDGHKRPDDIVNSYAVYHSTKRNNRVIINGTDTTYESYRTGKAFHIKRPLVWDNAGDTTWGTMRIDTVLGRMFIGVDSTWLANAVHPVIIDPTFGYTGFGSSFFGLADGTIVGAVITNLTENADLDSVWVGNWPDASGIYGSLALYDDDGNGPGNLLANIAAADSFSIAGNKHWDSVAISGSITGSQTLWSAFMTGDAGGNPDLLYDAGVTGTDNWFRDDTGSSNDLAVWTDPQTTTARTDLGFKFSIYYKYTISGGANPDISHIRRIKENRR